MPDFARSADPRVQAELDRLAMLSPGRDVLGLERIRALLDRLDNPQGSMPPAFHVAGTNGKGSTVAILRSILEAAGHQVHAFTSPHLVRFNERIRLAGTLVDDGMLADLLREVREASDGISPSFFEATTAAAFLAFSRVPADVCVIEVGLGGRLDATNVLDDVLACGIAALGLDHEQFLGSTLAEVAAEKAGIAKAGVPLVTMRYPEDAYFAISDTVGPIDRVWAPMGLAWDAWPVEGGFHFDDDKGTLSLPAPTLPGRHQWQNAALAVAMIRSQDRLEVREGAMADGIRIAHWPARLQRMESGPMLDALPPGSELWVDGAHNPSAAANVAQFIDDHWSDGLPLVILFASLTSKDSAGVLAPLVPVRPRVVALPIAGHDSRDPNDLAALAQSAGLEAAMAASLPEALAGVHRPSRVLVLGSLYLAGELLALNGSLPD